VSEAYSGNTMKLQPYLWMLILLTARMYVVRYFCIVLSKSNPNRTLDVIITKLMLIRQSELTGCSNSTVLKGGHEGKCMYDG